MRNLMLCILLLAVLPVATYSQSPAAEATATIGGRSMSIRYSSPSVRGRKIFGPGGLLSNDPTYPVWRAGANSATTFTTSGNLNIGGLAVPKGTYTLYMLVQDPNAWQLVISKETGQWGLEYNSKMDLGRVKMTMSKPPALVERLKYTLSSTGANAGKLQLEWENHVASVPIAAN